MIEETRAEGLNIAVVTLMLDDPPNDVEPPTPAGALFWRDSYGLFDTWVLADPYFSMVPGSAVGTPQETLIDPRTMRVEKLQEGFGGFGQDDPMHVKLLALARQNRDNPPF